MKIAYVYPEKLPSKKARAISVVNTACELSKIVDTTLIYEKSENNVLDFYELSCNLKLKELPRKFIIRSNKIFNLNLKKEIKKYDYFYVRHLKTAEFLIKNGANVIFECHEIFQFKNKKIGEIEKFVYENTLGLTFINKSLKKEINNSFNVSNLQKVIHNGCDFFEYKKKDFTSIKEIFYIGSLQKWKGVDFLVDVLNKKNIVLKMIGDGNRKKELLNKAANNIEFLGFKKPEEIKHILLNEVKLAVIPNISSHYNKFSTPIKLYEYLMTSNIVLASDFEPIKEIIKDGVNGFLFKAGDKKDFLNKLNYILSLPKEKLEKISKNAYETGKQFTWENRAKQIVDFIKEIDEKTNISSS
ncbi:MULTISPECIES: glycosyltransferase family 4 protein [unclassified Lebetimonas]|uniref:glycosyltransferase family 4 protein n=1 Tax=unclassified Lebetimonas TaxID=2648158 RepID=UPI000467DAA1|nr:MULTISPECIES: glycosyltransferase family 4 protein [unclassified Lebetimonas]